MPGWDANGDNGLDDYWQLQLKVGDEDWQNFIYDYQRQDEMADDWFHYVGGVWWQEPEWAANLDLSQFAGETVQLRWVMNTDDNMDGDQGTGFWLDDVRLMVEEGAQEIEDWIIYDDGQPSALIADDPYWVKTNFTAESEFDLLALQILPLNQYANHEDPMQVLVYRLDQESLDFAELAFQIEIEDVPDYPDWIEIDLGQDGIQFEQGETFAVLYDSPSGEYMNAQEGDGWWCLFDGNDDFHRSFWYSIDAFGDEFSDTHEDWAELSGDLFIRAGGAFAGEFEDVAVLSVSNADGLWNNYAETEIQFNADIANFGVDLEQCDVVFSVVTDDNDVIWENLVQLNDFAADENIVVEADEVWVPSMDELGHFTLFVDCNIDDDARIENNRGGMTQNILDPTGEELLWQRFNNFDYEFRRFGNDGNGWGVAFYHPGGNQPMTLADINFGMYSEEETETNFSVHILDANLNMSLVWEGHGMTTGQGAEWVDPVDFDYDPNVTINAGEAFVVTSYNISPEIYLLVDRDLPIDAMNNEMPGMTLFTVDNGETWEWWDDGDFFIMAALAPGGGGGEVPGLRHFVDFVETDLNHSHLVQALTMDGEDIPTGWEIGAFTPGGLLAGAVVWDDEERAGVSAFGDDANTEEIDGFQADEVVTFMLWDDIANREYRGEPNYIQGPQVWQNNGFTVMTLSAITDRDLVVPMLEGWNMMSINVSPGEEMYVEDEDRGPDVILMTAQLWEGDECLFDLFKDNSGRFYAPSWDFNNIPYWDLTNGYMIKALQDLEPVWTGQEIPADADIPMANGWNMIAYYPQYELDSSDPDFYVLSPIIDQVEIAKDIRGRFMSPSWDFSNMPPWSETNGYLVKVEGDVVLNYPPPEEGVAAVGVEPEAGQVAILTTHNMSLLVNNIFGVSVEAGDKIHAISADGRIVGAGVVSEDGRCGLAVWGDDPLTNEIEGLKDDEAFTLTLISAEDNTSHSLALAQVLAGKGVKYINDDLTVLDVHIESQIPENYYLAEFYPNPFNGTTRLIFGLPEQASVRIAVYDMQGRLVTSLLNENLQAGVHSVVWQAKNEATGVYIVKMDAGNFQTSRKIVLMN